MVVKARVFKALIFDLGGVYFTDGTAIALNRLKRNLNLPKKQLEDVFEETGDLGRAYREGRLSKGDFWSSVAERLGLKDSTIQEVREVWHSSYRLNSGMKELVEGLRRNYKVAALSNNIEERVEYLNRRYRLDEAFDVYVYSFEYGRLKPDPFLFREVTKRLGLRAKECVMVDNGQEVLNVAGSLGMMPILFVSANQLRRELEKLGVKCVSFGG